MGHSGYVFERTVHATPLQVHCGGGARWSVGRRVHAAGHAGICTRMMIFIYCYYIYQENSLYTMISEPRTLFAVMRVTVVVQVWYWAAK